MSLFRNKKSWVAGVLCITLGACANNSRFAESQAPAAQPIYEEPLEAQPAPVPAPVPQYSYPAPAREPSPYAGKIVDQQQPINDCDPATGQVFQCRPTKVVNMNGNIDAFCDRVSYSFGFRGRVNGLSCTGIHGVANLTMQGYRINQHRQNSYEPLYNRIPTMR
jgi:hypothetical protein